MYNIEKEEMNKIAPLFAGWKETLIWSCLQGYMGKAWADDNSKPGSAQIIVGDFCFYAGETNCELVRNIPGDFTSKSILMVPANEKWGDLIEQEYPDHYRKFIRYAIKKEKDVFDPIKLSSFLNRIPSGYSIRKIDKELYEMAKEEDWSRDLCSLFPTYNDYEKYGLGFAAVYEGRIVSGASSYTVYESGIEIEIDTKTEFRRNGLALACASALILECLNQGLYPSWDAANKESVALSEKLGYHFDKEYVTYAVEVIHS
jgi:GNAT superfamily N-acetyltransferase